MFFPFMDYETVSFDMHTNGSPVAIYNTTYKCMLVFELALTGANFDRTSEIEGTVSKSGSTLRWYYEETTAGVAPLGNTDPAIIGSMIVESGTTVGWNGDVSSGGGFLFGTIHVYRVPE